MPGCWPIKTILTGGQPITRQTVSCVGQICRHLLTTYGGSEFLLAATLVVSRPDEFVDHSSGHVVPGAEVKVVDSVGHTVPTGTTGELYLRSKTIFREYFNDPARTRTVLTEDGWYKSDDMGRILEDGSLFVEGRKSSMIICGGMNVAPEIIESLISRCPGVDGVVLVPVPDVVKYQVICACVKAAPGSDIDEASVRQFCEEAHGDSLGLFTILPHYYLVMDRFPETTTGKVSRSALTELAIKTFRR